MSYKGEIISLDDYTAAGYRAALEQLQNSVALRRAATLQAIKMTEKRSHALRQPEQAKRKLQSKIEGFDDVLRFITSQLNAAEV